MKQKNQKRSLLFYSIMLLSILSVGILSIGLLSPNVRNSLLARIKNVNDENSDGAPAHTKSIRDNGDGTYTIALDVTGESEPISVPDKKANVIIVMDTSGSMEDPADYSNANINSRTVASGNTVGRFCYNDNYYWRLYYRTGTNNSNYKYYPEGTGPDPTTRHQNVWYPDISNGQLNWVDWSGNNRTRYNFAINNNARIDETIVAVNNAIDTLLGQNTDKETEMVEIALISFGSNARYTSPTTVSGTWTSGKADGTAGTALKETVSTGLIPYGATNWDEALYYARQLAAQHDDGDDTYIIFFSDGEPTYYNGTSNGPTSHTHNNQTHPGNNGGARTDAEDYNTAYYEANQAHNSGYHLFGIFAYGSATGNGQTYMRTLTRYGNFGSASTSNAVDNVYYFSADNQEGINNAFSKIVSSIITNIGFSDVVFSDGTTAAKTASSGTVEGELLNVDTNSYKYYLSFPITDNNGTLTSESQYITEITKVSGTENDYQLKGSNGNTYTVTRVPLYEVDEHGKVDKTKPVNNVFKFEWKNASNPLHQELPPTATLTETKSVDWDLSGLSDPVLLNGITYTVEFDVYPSQVTLDIIADVKNNKRAIPEDGIIEDYIICDKETKDCTLKTNTEASLTYTDTRTDDGEQTTHYENPDSVSTGAVRTLAVAKEWKGFKTTDQESSITLNIDRDAEKNHYNITLKSPNWSADIYASIGIMTVNNGVVTIKPGTAGHDYAFSEDQNISYKWELEAPTVRPMMINGKITTLIKVNKPAGMSSTAQVYEEAPNTSTPENYAVIDGKNVYYKLGDKYYVVGTDNAVLKATNYRRSSLDLTKKTTGADAPEDAYFTYTIKIDEGNNEDVYFSIQDKEAAEDDDEVLFEDLYIMNSDDFTYVSGEGIQPEIKTLRFNGTTADPNIKEVSLNVADKTITYKYQVKEDKIKTYVVRYVDTLANGDYRYYPGYYYMPSGTTATIKIKAGWNVRFTNLFSDSKYTITESNTVIDSEENEITGFKFRQTKDQDNNVGEKEEFKGTIDSTVKKFKVEYTNEYTLTHVDVKKVWDDNHNQDGKRILKDEDENSIPVEFDLKQNGTVIQKIYHDGTGTTIDEETDEEYWETSFNDLPVYDNSGEEYVYTVVEVFNNEYYTTTSTGSASSGYVFTNTHTPETMDLTVTKEWDDKGDQDGKRPDEVKFQLKANGVNYKNVVTLTEDEDGNWTYTFEDLDVYANGSEIVYTVVETTIPENYELVKTEENPDGIGNKDNNYTITNKHTPETKDVTVTKAWSDDNNHEGFRPDSVAIKLYAGTAQNEDTLVGTANVTYKTNKNTESEWKYTFKDLDVYANGTEITYTIEEITVPNYTSTYDQDNLKVTNSRSVAKRTIDVKKVWSDSNDKEGFRPTSVTFNLFGVDKNNAVSSVTLSNQSDKDEDGNWIYTFEDLDVYANGTEINYTLDEVKTDVITGTDGTGTYSYEVTGNKKDGFVVTNKHTPKPISVVVDKEWQDDSDFEGFRPTQITVILHASDSTIEDETVTFSGTGNNWSTTFEDLLAYKNGKKITYTVEEVKKGAITGTDGTGTYSISIQETEAGYKIVNKHTPEKTTSTIIKEWQDNSNQDGVRPTTLKVTLSNGKVVELSGTGNTWSYTERELPKYKNGALIEYTWTEDEENLPEGYSLIDKKVSDDKLTTTLTNYRKTDKITIDGKKVWNDSNNNDKVRPATLDIQLFANGNEEGDPITLKASDYDEASNEWTFSIPNLEKKDGGVDIVYTVAEVSVPEHYTKETTEANPNGVGNKDNGYTITNTHTKETTSVSVKKVWEDDNNRDVIRPTTIEVQLKVGNDVVGNKVLPDSETGKWETTFTGLDKFLNGEEITYTVDELREGVINDNSKTGYSVNVTGDQKTGYIITNTHEIATTEIEVKKVWNDDDDRDALRPGKVIFNLYQDGSKTAYRSEEVTFKNNKSENTWYYTFENLPKYKNVDGTREEINYTIDENPVADYQGEVDGYTITNKHITEKVAISGYKVWRDGNNQDAKRPGKVVVKLNADGVFYDSVEVSGSGNEWKYEFTELPKHKNVNGKAEDIDYTVEEVNVPEGYTSTLDQENPLIIYNTYDPEETVVSGEKTWSDDNNREAMRPTSITVVLMADGAEKDTRVVTENSDGKWLYSFDKLPKYKNVDGKAKEIVYTISEIAPDGYAPSYSVNKNVTNIENIHEIEKLSITGIKAWEDEDDIEGFRPETITINLLADGEKIDTYTAKEAEGWKYEFLELPKYKNVNDKKEEIKYSLTEESVDGYTSDIQGYEVTNIHKVERVSYHINKVWDDDDNRDGIRPKKIVVTLNANGVAKKSITLDGVKDNEEKEPWSCDFVNLPKHSNGKIISYSITEDVHEGYSSSITTIDENTTEVTIINSHTPATTQVSGEKIWEGDEDHLDQRPKYITIKLLADGEVIDTITVKEDEDWKYIVQNLYKYKGGVPITYTIEELAVEGYITNYDGYNIINTRDSSGDVIPDEEPPHTSVDYSYVYEIIIAGLAGTVLLFRKEN